MAPDYYNGYGGGPSGKRRRSLVMRLVDLALTLVTLAVGATMVLTYFVPYVDPGSVWFFPVLGLAAPAVYVLSQIYPKRRRPRGCLEEGTLSTRLHRPTDRGT